MKPPLFWQNPPDRPGVAARWLHPLSLIWRAASDRRWRRGPHARLNVPVICVGNINMGGTGKTPTVIWLAERLRDFGVEPHIVSRGYGGSEAGPLLVAPDMSADRVGDEPLLLSAFAPTWVAKDRLSGARAAVEAGGQAILLDDGMQNPALAKDFTLLVVDAAQGFGNGRLFPAGPLRQSVSEGLARADAVLSIGPPPAQRRFVATYPVADALPHVTGELRPLETGMDWTGLHAFAFAGIGRPQKFFDTLRAQGATLAGTVALADHAPLSQATLTRLARQAAAAGAQLVTTEKDAARLPPEWRGRVLTLPVRLIIENDSDLLEKIEPIFEKHTAN